LTAINDHSAAASDDPAIRKSSLEHLMSAPATELAPTPYEMIGGPQPIRDIVDRFYDLMDADPAYADLRALHTADLAPMRTSLASFLAAWMGGPRDWFEERPGRCMMSAHKGVTITPATARQWAEAMRRAIEESPVDPAFGQKFAAALGDLALRMA
jgi:hemoglobin